MEFFTTLPKKVFIAIAFIIVLFGSAMTYFLLQKPQQPKPEVILTPTPPKAVKNLLQSVGEKIQLPADETPTVATVSDPKKLQNQPFFAKAQKGDKILMYLSAQKAYIYRPKTDEIIQASSLEVVSKTASESAEPNDSSVLRVRY